MVENEFHFLFECTLYSISLAVLRVLMFLQNTTPEKRTTDVNASLYDVGLTPVPRFSGIVWQTERSEYAHYSFWREKIPLEYFVGHKHGRMFSCQ